ncbi:MAG: alpha/beta fold hydrolase [Acidobacteriaceae bacterium]|nr:alpha/beta fold hydrolase [Acidobacteriaceae bacterium]
MLSDRLRVLYLHGFASSPASRKARFFAEKLAGVGIRLEIPDLAARDFVHLTISDQLDLIARVCAQEPVILIGSSLGGYLAALYASSHPEVDRLLLLAPAFQFYQLWANELGPERLELWRKERFLPIFHYGEEREMSLGYELMEDAAHYPPFPDFCQPALIFHGTQDRVVPVQYAAAYAETHPNARLICLDSGHELTGVLDTIWQEARNFLLK